MYGDIAVVCDGAELSEAPCPLRLSRPALLSDDLVKLGFVPPNLAISFLFVASLDEAAVAELPYDVLLTCFPRMFKAAVVEPILTLLYLLIKGVALDLVAVFCAGKFVLALVSWGVAAVPSTEAPTLEFLPTPATPVVLLLMVDDFCIFRFSQIAPIDIDLGPHK